MCVHMQALQSLDGEVTIDDVVDVLSEYSPRARCRPAVHA